jgi:hypothetical protein
VKVDTFTLDILIEAPPPHSIECSHDAWAAHRSANYNRKDMMGASSPAAALPRPPRFTG